MMITYLSPVAQFPIGGVRVLYAQAEMLTQNGFESCVFHPDDRKFSRTWFDHATNIRTDDGFVAAKDFVVIPEVWAGRYALSCHASGVKYAIFVQKGYHILPKAGRVSPQDLKEAFENAAIIMSISDDTSDMISFLFPTLPKDKIVRLFPHIGGAFQPGK